MANAKAEKKRSRYATFSIGEEGYESTVKINPDHVVLLEEGDTDETTLIRTSVREFVVNSDIQTVEELLNRARM